MQTQIDGLKWEVLKEKWRMDDGSVIEVNSRNSRAKVPGGWVVFRNIEGSGGYPVAGMCFLPDPNHEWDGQSLP